MNDKNSKGTHCTLLFFDRNITVYLEFFEIRYISQEVWSKMRDQSITRNVFRIKDNETIMCSFYNITLIEYILAGKTLQDYTNLFSLNDYKKNDQNSSFWV